MKPCKVCKQKFEPRGNTLQAVCSPGCAIEWAKTKDAQKTREKAIRQETKERKDDVQPLSHWVKRTQTEFNRMIRARDAGDPCISCGITYGQFHAGHYRTTAAAPELRFHPDNCHAQCSQCNNSKSGNIVEYRIRLVQKIGLAQVEWLEGPHEPANYTREQLEEMRKEFRAMTRELEAV